MICLDKKERRKIYIAAASAAAVGVGITAFVLTRRALRKKKADEVPADGADLSAESSWKGPEIDPYTQIAPGVYGVRVNETSEPDCKADCEPDCETDSEESLKLDSLVENKSAERSYTIL